MRAVYRLLFHLERDGVKVAPLNVVPIGTTEHLRDSNHAVNTEARTGLAILMPHSLSLVSRGHCVAIRSVAAQMRKKKYRNG